MFGYNTNEQLLKRNLLEFIAQEDRERAHSEIIKMHQGIYTGAADYKALKADNTFIDIAVNGDLIRNKSGAPARMIFVIRDVTERKRASTKLIEQKNYISSILAAIPDLVFLIDRKGVLLDVNPGKKEALYVPPEVFLHKNVADVLPPNLAKEFMFAVGETLAGKPLAPLQYNLPVKDKLPDFEARFTPFGDDKVIVLVSDISKRLQREKALKESEEKYRVLFYDSPDGYLIIRNGQIIECNKAAEKLIGGGRQQIIGRTPGQLSPEFQPNGRKSDEYAIELVNETIEKGESSFDWLHLRFDGTEVLIQINLTVITYEGEKVLFTTWHDITEQRKAEDELRKFRTISDQANYGNAISDLNGYLIYSNDAFARMHGYEVSEIVGHHLSMLHSEEQMIRVNETLDLLKQHGEFASEEVWRNSGATIGFLAFQINVPDLFHQSLIFNIPFCWFSALPLIICTPGNAKYLAHLPNGKLGAVPAYKPVCFPSLLEKMLTAFFRISRSNCASRSSFFNRVSSFSYSVWVIFPWPGKQDSGCFSASRRQRYSNSGRMSSSLASSRKLSCFLLSSTAICLNSLSYCLLFFIITKLNILA